MTPIVLPITGTVDASFLAKLAQIENAFEDIGRASDNTARIAGRSWLLTSSSVERARDVATEALNALKEKGAEFVRVQGDAIAQGLGGIAEVGLKALGAAGPWGAGAAAAVGAVGLIVTTMNSYQVELDRVAAASAAVATANVALGGSYASVAEAVRGATTAEAARVAVAQQVQAVTAAQGAALGEGFSLSQSRVLVDAYQQISVASRAAGTNVARFTQEQVQQALTSGNAAQQALVLRTAVERSSNADIERINVLRRTSAATAIVRADELARADQSYRIVRANVDGNRSMVEQIRAEGGALRVLTEARERANAATVEATRVENESAVAIINLNEQLARGAELTAEGASRKAKAAEQRAAAASGPSALEQRAAVEALRVAREANDNSRATVDIAEQVAEAQRALAFATNEVGIVERRVASAHRETQATRQALTQALTAQTSAQQALTTAITSESDAMREKLRLLREQALAMQMMSTIPTSVDQAMRASGDGAQGRAGIGRLNESADIAADAARQAATDEMIQQASLADVEKNVLAARLAEHETYTGRLRELQGEQSSGAVRAAEFTNAAFQSVGKALGNHIAAFATGKESIGAALQGMLADTLTSIGQEAMVKGAFETAQGLSALAGVVTAGLAPGHFAAAGAYFGVGALALAGGAALAPAPSVPSGGASGGAGSLSSDRASNDGGGLTIVENNYAPRFGGREGGSAEVGQRMDRFTRAEARRTQRAA